MNEWINRGINEELKWERKSEKKINKKKMHWDGSNIVTFFRRKKCKKIGREGERKGRVG